MNTFIVWINNRRETYNSRYDDIEQAYEDVYERFPEAEYIESL